MEFNRPEDFLIPYLPMMAKVKAGDMWVYHNQVKPLRGELFQDTMAKAKRGYYMGLNGKQVFIPYTADMIRESELYQCELDISSIPNPGYQTEITVVNEDCLPVGARLAKAGYKTAVLNMANRRTAGGAAYTGAGAQEETIFRRSNLCLGMYQFTRYASQHGLPMRREQYPLDRNFGGVYTPHVTVFRDNEQSGYALLDEPYQLAFISVAGLFKPDLTPDSQTILPPFVTGVQNKIRTILRIGAKHGHDALVLAPLGCGAFRNPPKHVARLFHEILEEPEFKGRFRKIVFAIIEDHNSVTHPHNPQGNFKPFADEFVNA